MLQSRISTLKKKKKKKWEREEKKNKKWRRRAIFRTLGELFSVTIVSTWKSNMAFIAEAAAYVIWKYDSPWLVRSAERWWRPYAYAKLLIYSGPSCRNLSNHHRHDGSNWTEDERGCVKTSRPLRQGYPGDRDPCCSIYIQRRRERMGKDRHRGRSISLFKKRRAIQQYSHNEQVAFISILMRKFSI